MIKLNILNMLDFLAAVNVCQGKVYMLRPDESKVCINRHYALQDELLKQFIDSKKILKLTRDNCKTHFTASMFVQMELSVSWRCVSVSA